MEEIITSILLCVGTVAFALSGSITATQKKLDYLGIIVLSGITALGGGMLRDVLLGKFPPDAFVYPIYACLAFGAAVIFIVARKILSTDNHTKIKRNLRIPFLASDAVGLSIFTISGMNAAYAAGFASNVFLCIFVGIITGVGGGMLRDVLAHQTPSVLKEDIYALPALLGGIIYYLLRHFDILTTPIDMIIAGSVIFGVRLLAVKKGWSLPTLES